MTLPKIRLEPWHQLVLGALGLLVAAVFAVRFLFVPLLGHLDEARSTWRDLDVKIADAQTLIGQLPEQERGLEQAMERYRSLESRLGAGRSVAQVLELLAAQAKEHRLELVAVQPRAESQPPKLMTLGPELVLREVPLTLELNGRYRQIGEFLGTLAGNSYVAVVKTMRVTRPQAEGPKLKAQIELTVYVSDRSA